MKPTLLAILLAGCALSLASCSTHYTAIDENTPGASYEKGVPGGTVVETQTLIGIVAGLDVPNRKVTLVGGDGKKTTVKCGSELINFDQLQLGDRVLAIVTAELTVAMAEAQATLPNSAESLAGVASGETQSGSVTVVETQQYAAIIRSISLRRHRVTLRFPDGEDRTFAVRKDVDLSQRKVGEAVVFRVRVATAISIERVQSYS